MLLKEDRAFVWFQNTQNQSQNRRLARAALTDDDEALLRGDSQRDIIENLFVAEPQADLSQFNDVLCRDPFGLQP